MQSYPSGKIRALVLDLGGVVLKNARNINLIHPLVSEKISYSDLKREYFLLSGGELGEEEFFRRTGVTGKILKKALDTHEPNNGIRQLLSTAKELGIPVYCLTNNFTPWVNYILKRHKIVFSRTIVSDSAKSRKPDRKIYEYFLKETGLLPENCLFVDDRAENLLPAEKLGFRCLLLRNPSTENPGEYGRSVSGLFELGRLLESEY